MPNLILHTAGVMTVPDILAEYKERGYNISSLPELLNTQEDAEYSSLDPLADPPVLLHLTSPFPQTDLKQGTLDVSPLYRLTAARLEAFLKRARYHAQEGRHDIILVGYEYGLAFVPMGEHHREEIRRMAALQALCVQYAHRYQISFPGGAAIPVKPSSEHLAAENAALKDALHAALRWIDSVPASTVLPAMPGFDRDDVDALLSGTAPNPPLRQFDRTIGPAILARLTPDTPAEQELLTRRIWDDVRRVMLKMKPSL